MADGDGGPPNKSRNGESPIEAITRKAAENTEAVHRRQEQAIGGLGDRHVMWAAQDTAEHCGRCGGPFVGGTIWRVGVTLPGFSGWGTYIVPMCERCRPAHAEPVGQKGTL